MPQKILLVGEPMGLFIANEVGCLEDVNSFSTAVAGAEFNVAIGLSRLEHQVGYLTKLGNDPFGRRIIKVMNQNNISTELVSISSHYPTGFMLKSKVVAGDSEIFYFRKHSAASTLCPRDIDQIDFSGFGILHMTGILPALSKTTLQAAKCLIARARENNLKIFFDPNLRPQLWKNRLIMVSTLNELAFQSDYFLPGVKEGEILMGNQNPKGIAEFYLGHGVKNVIVKTGASGAFASNGNSDFTCPTFQEDKIVDTVGAGDGFAAGVLSAVNEGLPLYDAVKRGNAIGTIQIQSVGDNDGLPTRRELMRFMETHHLKEV